MCTSVLRTCAIDRNDDRNHPCMGIWELACIYLSVCACMAACVFIRVLFYDTCMHIHTTYRKQIDTLYHLADIDRIPDSIFQTLKICVGQPKVDIYACICACTYDVSLTVLALHIDHVQFAFFVLQCICYACMCIYVCT